MRLPLPIPLALTAAVASLADCCALPRDGVLCSRLGPTRYPVRPLMSLKYLLHTLVLVASTLVNLDASAIRQKPDAPFQQAKQAVDLSQAERIVSVGRGIKEQANIKVAEELARALGAELAASRPICDSGWLPMERQVGSSGQTVAPKLYLALGISGAIQHLVGMKGANTIVAINKDPDAPIFEIADYGIVGDLFEIVPAMIDALKQ